MCGDIMTIWNVKSATLNLEKLTLIKSAALLDAKKQRELSLLGNTKTRIKAWLVLLGGMLVLRESKLNLDTGESQKPRRYLSRGQKNTQLNTQKKSKPLTGNMVIEKGAITQASLTGMRLKQNFPLWEMPVFIVAAKQILKSITSLLCHAGEQTILITCNLYAKAATAQKEINHAS